MVLSGIALAVAAQLLGLESVEWAFVLVFWFGILLSVPALIAVLLTGVVAVTPANSQNEAQAGSGDN
jgi:hypothetical protein